MGTELFIVAEYRQLDDPIWHRFEALRPLHHRDYGIMATLNDETAGQTGIAVWPDKLPQGSPMVTRWYTLSMIKAVNLRFPTARNPAPWFAYLDQVLEAARTEHVPAERVRLVFGYDQ